MAVAALPEEVRHAVVETYYPRQVAASDAARSRAQAAYAVASGIALALVAAGALANLGSSASIVRWIAVAAVGAWLITAFMFLRAVGPAARERVERSEIKDPSEFVRYVLNTARHERDDVDARVRLAYGPTLIAIALTIATVVSVAAVRTPTKASAVVLSPHGERAIRQICPQVKSVLSGRVRIGTLNSNWVTIHVESQGCHGRTQLLLARDLIDAVGVAP